MALIYRCEDSRHPDTRFSGLDGTPHCPVCKERAVLASHRTPLKVLLNPILRWFGWEIVSKFPEHEDKFIGYKLQKYNKKG